MATQKEEPRKRRSTGEVERLITEAALQLFTAKGFAGTTTREIAELADVHEPMVYRRFGSKAELFEATVLAPFNELISEYLEVYAVPAEPDPGQTLEERVRPFFESFYDLLFERRNLVLALVAASRFHDDFSDDGELPLTGFGALLTRLEPQLEVEASRWPLAVSDPPAMFRVLSGTVVGIAVLGDWLQPEDQVISRERILDEIVRVSLYGVTARDESPAPEPRVDVRALLDRVADAERRAIRAELELSLLSGRQSG